MKETTTLRISTELKNSLTNEAYELGFSFNEYVILILSGKINRKEKMCQH